MNFIAKWDPDAAKGAVEPSRPQDDTVGNVAPFKEQLDHRFQDPMNQSSDSGMPGVGQTPEFSMERQEENQLLTDMGKPVRPRDMDADADPADTQDQGPGEMQHQNQGDREDPLAA